MDRASDHDREVVVDALAEHASTGRLTLAEHEERVAEALVAPTRGELASLVADLPALGTSAAVERRRKPARWLVSVMGGSDRSGRWRVSERLVLVSVMGGQDIDLRHAEIDDSETTITAVSIMGGCEIYVPDSVDVEVSGFALMGGHSEVGSTRQPRPGSPHVHVRAFSLMGGVDVCRLPQDLNDLSGPRARRVLRRSRRGGHNDGRIAEE